MACNAPVIWSFVTIAPPPPTGMGGDSRANVRGNDILSSPAVPGMPGLCYKYTPVEITGVYLCYKYTPVEITIIKSGAMIVRTSPQCRAFNRAVIYEKSLSPLFPVGGGSGYKWPVHNG